MQEHPNPAGVSAPDIAHADRYVRLQHLFHEKLATLFKTGRVVGKKHLVHDVRKLLFAGQILGENPLSGEVAVAVRALFLFHPIGHFRHVFAITMV